MKTSNPISFGFVVKAICADQKIVKLEVYWFKRITTSLVKYICNVCTFAMEIGTLKSSQQQHVLKPNLKFVFVS